jgi:hypothetical protein
MDIREKVLRFLWANRLSGKRIHLGDTLAEFDSDRHGIRDVLMNLKADGVIDIEHEFVWRLTSKAAGNYTELRFVPLKARLTSPIGADYVEKLYYLEKEIAPIKTPIIAEQNITAKSTVSGRIMDWCRQNQILGKVIATLITANILWWLGVILHHCFPMLFPF